MATGRMLRASISTDLKVNSLDDFSQLLFTWMIPHADDWGCLTGEPMELWAIVIPFKRDKTGEDISKALKQMVDAELIWWYEANGKKIIQFCKWEENQQGLHKRTSPKLPLYKDVMDHGGNQNNSKDYPQGYPQENPQNDPSGNFREFPGNSVPTEQNGTEGKGTEDTAACACELAFLASTTREDDIASIQEFLDAGMEPDVIRLAILKMRDKPGARYSYAKSTLKSWKAKGYYTLQAAQGEWKGDKGNAKIRGRPGQASDNDDFSDLVVPAR